MSVLKMSFTSPSDRASERHRIVVNGQLNTQVWEAKDRQTGAKVLCKREGNNILVGMKQLEGHLLESKL